METEFALIAERMNALRITETELRKAASDMTHQRYWRAKTGRSKHNAQIVVIRELESALDAFERERGA